MYINLYIYICPMDPKVSWRVLANQKITLPSNPFTTHLHLHCLMPPCIVDTTQLAQGQHADSHTTIAVGRYFLVDTKKLLSGW